MTASVLTFVEIDIPRCALSYGIAPCMAQLGYADGTSPVGVTFDATNDYLTRDAGLTGAADSKKGTFSCWVRRKSLQANGGRLLAGVSALGGGTGRSRFNLSNATNVFNVNMFNAAGTAICVMGSTGAPTQDEWVHLLASVDLADTAKRHIYIDDHPDLSVTTYTDDTIDWTLPDWGIGAYPDGTNKLDGDLAELWCAPGVYLDLSVEANRRKFISADGRPVDLGATGEIPTGSAPLVYMSGDAATWHTNKATGGGFTLHGTLDEAEFATGAIKCFNSLGTCQDRVNFDEETVTLRFAVSTADLPADIDCIPCIRSHDDVRFTPAIVSLGQDLGQRATLSVTLQDHRDSDTGPAGDKYLAERSYNPFELGTYFGKFRARHPYLRGRPIRIIRGLVGEALEDMETRHYVIEAINGPSPDGTFEISGHDVLKLADDDRAQAPVLSDGFLVAGIDDNDTAATLSPAGIGNAKYSASGYVAIGGKEICAFTRSGDALTLTRAQLNTEPQAHEAQDRVQLCLRYVGEDVADIIADLLENYAGVSADYIPIDAWQTETASFLGVAYTATIAEPTAVRDLLSELIEQAALALWWDDSNRLLRLQVLRAVATTADRYSEEVYLKDSLTVRDQPDKRISQVWTSYGQVDPTKNLDDLDNYRSAAATVDLQAETDYGSSAIRKIFSRWIPSGGRATAQRLNDILLARFVAPPRRFNFSVFRTPGGQVIPILGQGYLLAGKPFQDATGAEVDVPIQVTSLNPTADSFELEAEEMLGEASLIDPTQRAIIFDANENNVNLRTRHDELYPEPESGDEISVYINAGVIIGSSSTALRALDIGSWPAGVTITLNLSGRIQGRGGNGGNKVGGTGTSGSAGGPALYTRTAIDLVFSAGGEIWAGGGGGAGDGDGSGGGGAGQLPGLGGGPVSPGSPGTTEAGGAGNVGGGNGGGPGLAGQNSSDATGGAAGTAIDGVSYIGSSTGTPDIRGAQIN